MKDDQYVMRRDTSGHAGEGVPQVQDPLASGQDDAFGVKGA